MQMQNLYMITGVWIVARGRGLPKSLHVRHEMSVSRLICNRFAGNGHIWIHSPAAGYAVGIYDDDFTMWATV